VSESSHPIDAEAFDSFAQTTTEAILFGDFALDALEDRIIALEQLVAARWPRRLFVRRRLAAEIRRTVTGYAEVASDFRGRRIEWAGETVPLASLGGRARRAANPD